MSKWKPKNSRFTRQRKQPRNSLSGKFSRYADYTAQDVKNQSCPSGRSCLIRSKDTAFGIMRGRVWWLPTREYKEDKKGTKRPIYKRAVQVQIEDTLRRQLTDTETMRRTCSTVGCLNPQHYVVEEKEMFTREQARIIYETAIRDGSVRLPYGDTKLAQNKRLGLYKHRAYFKANEPGMWIRIEDYELVIRDGDVVCQRKGSGADDAAIWEKAGLPTVSDYTMSQQTVERFTGTSKATPVVDEGDKVLTNLGYAPTKELPTTEDNDCPYNFDNPPEPSDPEYDAFVGWAMSPEGKAAMKLYKEKEND